MDANDEKIINEQLKMLEENEDATRHAIANQLVLLNETIAHVGKLEEVLQYNENLPWNATKGLFEEQRKHLKREEIDELFIVINAISTDLIRDQEDIIIYLNNLKMRILHPQLIPIEKIISQLKETTLHLPQGINLPFTLPVENWLKMEKYMTTTAYYDNGYIYTIIKAPLITYPPYETVRVISLPTHQHENLFAFIEITHIMIAINRESDTYIVLNDHELDTCMKDNDHYTCYDTYPITFFTSLRCKRISVGPESL